jgi:hypothetical protein
MQYVRDSLQEIAQVMASCDELGIAYTVENGSQAKTKKRKIGFLTVGERVEYETIYVLTVKDQGGEQVEQADI